MSTCKASLCVLQNTGLYRDYIDDYRDYIDDYIKTKCAITDSVHVLRSSGISRKSGALIVRYKDRNRIYSCTKRQSVSDKFILQKHTCLICFY